jgi:TPR repeat protein
MVMVGYCYHEGKGVKRDDKEAFKWYSKAFKKGNRIMAAYNLSICYANGQGVEKDEKEAFRYMKISADNNEARSMYYIGGYYEFGIGTEINKDLAMQYYHSSANLGYKEAIDALGKERRHVELIEQIDEPEKQDVSKKN